MTLINKKVMEITNNYDIINFQWNLIINSI